MIIERICLEDLGVFRNQIIQGIKPGLVVIAGGNRAGKTTLMNALRYLGYGLPKRANIPPPSGEQHLLSADIRLHDGGRHTIQLTGHGAPRISPLEGSKAVTVEEIYGELDGYTYRQIFTISLDELRRIPDDISSRKEEHLQAVLLGGGWSEAFRLIQIRQEFAKKAHDIGGKKGAKNTFQFKPWSQTLRQGIELRDSANKQLDDFYKLQAQLTSDKDILVKLEEDLRKKQQEHDLQELIRDHYETYREIKRLTDILETPENKTLLDTFPHDGVSRSQQLLKQLPKAIQKYNELFARFEASIGSESLETVLNQGKTLDSYEKRLSGWRHEAQSLEKIIEEHKQTEAEMISDSSLLNADWGKKLSHLETLQLDFVNEERLLVLIANCAKIHTSMEENTREIEKAKTSLTQKESQANGLNTAKSSSSSGVFALTAIGLAAILFAAALLGPIEALATGIAAGAGILAYVLYNVIGSKGSRKELLDQQIQDLKDELIILEKQGTAFEVELQQVTVELKVMLQSLNLPENLPYTAVPDFLRKAGALKKRYNIWLAKGSQIGEQIARQNLLKTEISNLLGKVGLSLGEPEHVIITLNNPDSTISEHKNAETIKMEDLFDLLTAACAHLALARELKESQLEKEKLEKEVLQLVKVEVGSDYIAALDSLLDKGEHFDQLKQDQQSLITLEAGLRHALATPKYSKLINNSLSKNPHSAQDHVQEDDKEGKNPIRAKAKGDILIESFGKLCAGYASVEEAELAYVAVNAELQELFEDVRKTQNQIPATEERLAQLNSDKQLFEANRIISEARQSLEEMAEEYAINRLAELITSELYGTLIEETKEKTLGKAGEILSCITSGEYSSIDLSDENSDRDFLAVPLGRDTGLPSQALSRGTKEQLFLSVRLSRIRGISSPLPVIIDDSLANFDPVHMNQTVEIMAQLAKTHQVFILTCHPELLKAIEKTNSPAQYWYLNQGVFTGPFADSSNLTTLLSEGIASIGTAVC